MATKHVSDYASSPANDDSDDDGQGSVGSNDQEEEDIKPANNTVADILKKYSSSVLFKKPKQENHCFTCSQDFPDVEALHSHLIQHVSLPSLVLDKLPSDDEDTAPSGDENWSDEDEAPPPQPPKTPQKIDISQILKKTGITLKKPTEPDKSADSALNKLSGLGFTIKKSNTPIKKEPESENANNVIEKLGKLGGIKLKLKSDGNNSNSFKVINGLKDFNASDDENEPRDDENDESKEEGDMDDEQDKSGEQEGSAGDNDSEGDNEHSVPVSRKNSDSDDSGNISAINKKLVNSLKNLQGKAIVTKIEPKTPNKPGPARLKEGLTSPQVVQQAKPLGRPAVKQTPKRGLNFQSVTETPTLQVKELVTTTKPAATPERRESYPERRESNPERRESQDRTMDRVIVKQEIETVESQSSNVPIFSGQIKSERASPPPNDVSSTPALGRIKTEPDFLAPPTTASTLNHNQPVVSTTTTPLLPVTKTEDAGMTIIEINGDSNDEDDDCCVVSATPAPEVKPKTEFIPKTENTSASFPPPAYPTSQPSFSSTSTGTTSLLSNRLAQSTEKQHNFNWNAPDSKPPLDMLEKSADEIFESLLSNSTKKELSLSDASEYISLDTLGPQHSCEVCNTRFTDISLLEEHRRMTGHSNSIIPASSSTLLPYTPASNLLSSLIPVKQIADQVGKLSTITGSSAGFTHQQNVMINIQAYPGAGGVMMPPQGYGSYAPRQTMPPDYSHSQNNMYSTGQAMPGQYPGQNYMGQHGYGQYQPPMSKPGYPGSMPNQFPPSSSPYSVASPLQGMQQAVYGQAPTTTLNTHIGQMGPPGAPPYVQASSPGGSMKPPTSSGLKIQNVQTFPPGQALGSMIPGQTVGGLEMGGQPSAPGQGMGQMQSPSQIRMAAGANITGMRPRMAAPRGIRPTIRPGIQVHSQVRGQKPGVRMPMKRPAGMPGGPGQKRRTDMLLPGKHDNEDCQVMAMQRQREGLPMIQSVQGAKDKLNLGSQISITKKTVNKEANAMANVLASRGISIKQKQKSRSPTPERPIPHIPNLGAGMSIKHTSKSSNFSIPESKVGGGMLACKICKKMFMNQSSLSIHMSNAHPQSKLPVFKCDECPASYPKSLQLQHHKRVFHNVTGPNRELGLPVVDLSQEDNLKRLGHLGIYSFIPLANREQGNGCFGIPVISVHNMQNGLTSSLQALGADGLLSLGPLKPLPSA